VTYVDVEVTYPDETPATLNNSRPMKAKADSKWRRVLTLLKANRPRHSSWLLMTPEEVATNIRLKAARINTMLQTVLDWEKIADELKDLAILCYFLLAREVRG
jgi:hypothetical protein